MNAMTLAGSVIASPFAAFAELKERPSFWLPMLACIVATAAMTFWYYQIVDFEWLKDHLFAGSPDFENMPAEQRAAMNAAMSPTIMSTSAIVGVAIVMPLMFAIQAAYYLLAGKVTNVQYSFKHWLSLVSWSSVPALIGALAAMLVILSHGSNAQMGPSELQILSVNELFLHLKPTEKGAQWAGSMGILQLWGWALFIIGVKIWSNKTWTFSVVFVMLPIVLVYGIWAYFAFA
jgi:hypothetical protein